MRSISDLPYSDISADSNNSSPAMLAGKSLATSSCSNSTQESNLYFRTMAACFPLHQYSFPRYTRQHFCSIKELSSIPTRRRGVAGTQNGYYAWQGQSLFSSLSGGIDTSSRSTILRASSIQPYGAKIDARTSVTCFETPRSKPGKKPDRSLTSSPEGILYHVGVPIAIHTCYPTVGITVGCC